MGSNPVLVQRSRGRFRDRALPRHIQQLIEAQAAQNPKRLTEIVDYLVVTTDDHGGRTPAGWDGAVWVASDVRIEQLEPDFAARLLRATELRGEDPGPRVAVEELCRDTDNGIFPHRKPRRRDELAAAGVGDRTGS